jgi:hypothetical protein
MAEPASPRMPRAPKGVKPGYFADPATDKLLQMVITLAGELSVTRDRLDAVERLATRQGLFDRGALATLSFSAEEAAERAQNRADFVARVLRVLDQELAELNDPSAKDHATLVRELGRTE